MIQPIQLQNMFLSIQAYTDFKNAAVSIQKTIPTHKNVLNQDQLTRAIVD